MIRKIIINADDFGLSLGVNQGIAQAHNQGILTSTSIMTNMPAAENAVEIAKKTPSLAVGLHLNLTAGKPTCRYKITRPLVDRNGMFCHSPSKLCLITIISPAVRTAVRAEAQAQLCWLVDHGIRPTHIDSHHHIHVYPLIFSIVFQLARRYRIHAVRYCYEPAYVSKSPWPLPALGLAKKAARIRTFAKINRFQNASLFRTNALLGISHFSKIDCNFFKTVAAYDKNPCIEIVTHPGFSHDIEQSMTSLITQRENQLETLCDDKTKKTLETENIKLVHFGNI
jgi:predicted glycoside hydrolase/deacetylase ChbG (UPF0249 family)